MSPTATAFPLLAGLVAAAFAALVWQRHARHPRAHSLAWGLGLSAYAVASLVEAAVEWQGGWSAPLYRAYFPLSATLVGLLGLGTVYLSRSRRVGHAFALFVAAGFVVAALGPFTVPLHADAPVESDGVTRPLGAWGPELGADAVPFPHPARVAFLALNVVGGLALIGGALVSAARSHRAGVLLIGLGAVFPFGGGTLSSLGVPEARVVAQFLGIVIMFVGYVSSTFPRPGVHAGAAAAAQE